MRENWLHHLPLSYPLIDQQSNSHFESHQDPPLRPLTFARNSTAQSSAQLQHMVVDVGHTHPRWPCNTHTATCLKFGTIWPPSGSMPCFHWGRFGPQLLNIALQIIFLNLLKKFKSRIMVGLFLFLSCSQTSDTRPHRGAAYMLQCFQISLCPLKQNLHIHMGHITPFQWSLCGFGRGSEILFPQFFWETVVS